MSWSENARVAQMEYEWGMRGPAPVCSEGYEYRISKCSRIHTVDLRIIWAEADYAGLVDAGEDPLEAAWLAAERNGLKEPLDLDCGELPRDTMAIDAAFGAPPPPADPASDEYARWQYDWEPVTMHADSRDAAEGPAIQ